MLGFLPDSIKEQVLYHLKNDNFPAAKEIYEKYLAEQRTDIE